MQSKSEGVSLLEDHRWILDLVFLKDLSEEMYHMNCELQGRDKTISHMMSTVNMFEVTMYIWVFMTLITVMFLCVRSQDSLPSERKVHIVFLTAGFKGVGRLCPKSHENTVLRRGIHKASHTSLGSSPSYWCTCSRLYPRATRVKMYVFSEWLEKRLLQFLCLLAVLK